MTDGEKLRWKVVKAVMCSDTVQLVAIGKLLGVAEPVKHNLSKAWRTVLAQLVTYGEGGIDRDELCEMMGASCATSLDQMWFGKTQYFKDVIDQPGRIAITTVGHQALLQSVMS